MNKTLQLTIFLLAIAIQGRFLNAQEKLQKLNDLQKQKMAFFNEKLELTSGESSKFWPVYNDYQNRRDKITRDRNTLLRYAESNKLNMTDEEAAEALKKYLAYQEEETKLLEIYTAKFMEFLPPKKIIKIYIVELQFKKWLLTNLRDTD